jgi:hypothetical protein
LLEVQQPDGQVPAIAVQADPEIEHLPAVLPHVKVGLQLPQLGATQESPLHVFGAVHEATEPPQTLQASRVEQVKLEVQQPAPQEPAVAVQATPELEQIPAVLPQVKEGLQVPQTDATQESPLQVLGAVHEATEPPQKPQASRVEQVKLEVQQPAPQEPAVAVQAAPELEQIPAVLPHVKVGLQVPQLGDTQESPLHVLGAVHEATEPPQ